jgi:two-component system chemotaxis response regulator CheB
MQKALIIDDSKAIRRILGSAVRELGFEVSEAENGRLALKTLIGMLAERLASKSRLRVEEAGEGRSLEPGLALIAPGGRHMKFGSEKGSAVVALDDGPPENSCRPAVDVMFRSVASIYGRNSLAVILTGMGRDGFDGTKQLKAAGASVLAQDRATSVVWGMPGYVVEAGLADIVAGIDDIGPTITSLARRRER